MPEAVSVSVNILFISRSNEIEQKVTNQLRVS